MATNKQLFSIQKYLSSSAVDKFKLDRVFEVNKAKTPQLYNDIINDVQFLENNGLFILIDGEDVQVKYANGIKVWSDALDLSGGGGEPTEVTWDDVTDKPTTFEPSAHQHNASDINAGTLNITRIPTGTTATTVSLGNHTHAFSAITGTATSTQIPNLDAGKITTGTFALARVNSPLTGYTVGDQTAITATDTISGAIAKLDARVPMTGGGVNNFLRLASNGTYSFVEAGRDFIVTDFTTNTTISRTYMSGNRCLTFNGTDLTLTIPEDSSFSAGYQFRLINKNVTPLTIVGTGAVQLISVGDLTHVAGHGEVWFTCLGSNVWKISGELTSI